MDYTGYKDEDGKDIYEGDYVKIVDKINNIQNIGRVFWNNGWWYSTINDKDIVYERFEIDELDGINYYVTKYNIYTPWEECLADCENIL
jgi:hypothetical protein